MSHDLQSQHLAMNLHIWTFFFYFLLLVVRLTVESSGYSSIFLFVTLNHKELQQLKQCTSLLDDILTGQMNRLSNNKYTNMNYRLILATLAWTKPYMHIYGY